MVNPNDPFHQLLAHVLVRDQAQRQQEQMQQNAMQAELYRQNLQQMQSGQRQMYEGALFQQMRTPEMMGQHFGAMLGKLGYGVKVADPEHWNDDPYWKEYMLECQRELREWDEALGIDQTGR